MEDAVEHRGDGGGIAEESSPVIDRTVRGEQGAGPFVATHDELEPSVFAALGVLAATVAAIRHFA